MKTIITTLPVYDKIAKQFYERSKLSGHEAIPIISPRHRFPSMLWNVESDDPGPIENMQLMTKDGIYYDNIFTITPVNVDYPTYTIAGNTVSIVNNTSSHTGKLTLSKTFNANRWIVVKITLNYVSGEYPLVSTQVTSGTSYERRLKNGANTVYIRNINGDPTVSGYVKIRNTTSAQFSITINSIEESTLPLVATGNEMLDNGYSGNFRNDELADGTWDVFTSVIANREATLQKTTSAGMFGLIFRDTITMPIITGNKVFVSVDLNLVSGTAPRMAILNHVVGTRTVLSNVVQLANGLNQFVLTATGSAANTRVVLYNQDTETSSFVITVNYIGKVAMPSLLELTDSYFIYSGETLGALLPAGSYYLKMTSVNGDIYYSDYFRVECVYDDDGLPPVDTYSSKYLIINFDNSCDLGELLYHTGFTQTLWFESETMETSFPTEEEGQNNGEGKFIRTFARQTKKYLARTKQMPDYMVDVFHRMKLHDTITLTDLVGDINIVHNLEVEHEWLFDDKYSAKVDLTFDYDETALVSGCCVNIT